MKKLILLVVFLLGTILVYPTNNYAQRSYSRPSYSRPSYSRSSTSRPSTYRPNTYRPTSSKPSSSKPSSSKPSSSKPSASKPPTSESSAIKSSTYKSPTTVGESSHVIRVNRTTFNSNITSRPTIVNVNNTNQLYKSGCYTSVTRLDQSVIHSMQFRNMMIFYILMYNNNTHSVDTIAANSEYELRRNVESRKTITNSISPLILYLIGIGLILSIIPLVNLIFYVNKKLKNKSQTNTKGKRIIKS